jgi:arylamine N-acetyltransferase
MAHFPRCAALQRLRQKLEVYRVIPYPRYDGEYEITNWYTGTHPDAPYQSNIIAARPGPDRTRITMFNRRVTVRHATGEADRRHLEHEAEFRTVLREEFGLNMTDDEIRTCIEIMERKGEKGDSASFLCLKWVVNGWRMSKVLCLRFLQLAGT